MVNSIFLRTALLVFATMLSSFSHASEAFKIQSIEVEGNQKISFETIRSYLSFEKGDVLDENTLSEGIKSLYKTGFFNDVGFYRLNNNRLVIWVEERPSITDISIEGNDLISEEDLETALETLGLKKGRIFNKTQMDRVALDLRRRYQNQGHYAAEVEILVKDLSRNRVSIQINIEEGEPATIGRISFVGNYAYGDNKLKSQFLLSDDGGDQYSKPKLQSDIETLKSYYLDRGFAEFKVISSQVSLSADKATVFITLNVSEGPQYKVRSIQFSGETIVDNAELRDLLKLEEKTVFSRIKVIQTMNAIRDRLSEEGYAFAEVKPLSNLDKDTIEVDLDFRIEPKDRVYVRRIYIEGNTRTQDHVIRREMRQYESAPYSLSAVRRSNTRLNRLGFFQSASVDTKRVSKDQVDLVVKVKEQSTGSLNAGVSYSQLDGVGLNLGITERNVIGSGYSASLNTKYSKSSQTIDLGVTNPYFTEDGVSLGGSAYLNRIDASELGVADYVINNFGIRLRLGYPLSEIANISYGMNLDSQELLCDSGFTVCNDHVEEFGKQYDSVRFSLGWTRDTKNAFYFPSEGQVTSINFELARPIETGALSFYKVYLKESIYFPMSEHFTFKLRANLAYGDTTESSQKYPFFENFYAGGIGTVRGYEPNSLGEKYDFATEGSTTAKGGRARVTSGAEILFPMPFIEDSSSVRFSLFYDIGNVYSDLDAVDASSLRTAYGLGLSWITPVGPLQFSFANAINAKATDDKQFFQFTLGVPM